MSYPVQQILYVEKKDAKIRLDIFVSSKLKNFSRSSINNFIKKKFISVEKKPGKSSYKVKEGDKIYVDIPEPSEEPFLKPEPLDIEIIFEDADIAVINKPPKMVVHPAPGNPSKTLVNAVLYLCPDIKGIGGVLRPGIVHRLDKDTSGAIVIAKNDYSLNFLGDQFKAREVKKKYFAVVHGVVKEDKGIIDLPIGRHKIDRKKMSAGKNIKHARNALTIWKVKKRFKEFSFIEVEIKTGRTHQIRVHCVSMGHPVAGDEVYGFKGLKQKDKLLNIKRQMLHSRYIEFTHPASKKRVSFNAPLFEDMEELLLALE